MKYLFSSETYLFHISIYAYAIIQMSEVTEIDTKIKEELELINTLQKQRDKIQSEIYTINRKVSKLVFKKKEINSGSFQ